MAINWFWLAMTAGISSALFNFTGRKSLNKGDYTAFSWLFEVFRFSLFGLFALFDYSLNISLYNILLLISIGFTEFVSVYVFTKMHSLVELSVTSVLTRLRLVWVPIIAWFVLNETLSSFQYVGLLMITLGAVVTVKLHDFRYNKGIKIAFLSSLLVAVLSIQMKIGAEIASTPVLMMFIALPTMLLYPLKMKQALPRIRTIIKLQYKEVFLFSLSNTASMYFLVSALRVGEAGPVMGVYQGVSLISLPLGIILLKENTRIFWKLAGALIAFIGMLLLR